MTHGDDCVLTGPTERLTEFENQNDRGVFNQSNTHQSVEQKAALWKVYQRDPRHVDVLVKDLGLEHGNSVQTPATHDVTEEETEPLDQVQHSKYRSQVARFLCQDQADNIHSL